MHYTDSDVTQLLQEWNAGDPDAVGKLIPLVLDDIRDIARRALAREGPGHTLQTTALVNELYLKLVDRRTVTWKNRQHFLGAMAQLIRRILVDHARRRLRAKRGGGDRKISLDEKIPLTKIRPKELVALDDALTGLHKIDPRQSQIVDLRFFVGLSLEEVADVLGVSLATVGRDWKIAKMWLRRELSQQ